MALGILLETLLFWGGQRKGFSLAGSLLGMFCRQVNQEACGRFGFRGTLV